MPARKPKVQKEITRMQINQARFDHLAARRRLALKTLPPKRSKQQQRDTQRAGGGFTW